jgi:hypothetical protein
VSAYLKVAVHLDLEDYLAALLELARQGLLAVSPRNPVRIAGGYFRKRAPQLLVNLPPGFIIEDAEVIFPKGYHGDTRNNAPSQLVVDRYLMTQASNDLAYGNKLGETVCWLSEYDSSTARSVAVKEQVEKAATTMRMVRRARSRGFVPLKLDLIAGTARLSGPGGIICLQAGQDGRMEIWGENFTPTAACHDPIEALAREGHVLERRAHMVPGQELQR